MSDTIAIKQGVTDIINEQGSLLLHIELSDTKIIVYGPDGTPVLSSWLDTFKVIADNAHARATYSISAEPESEQ